MSALSPYRVIDLTTQRAWLCGKMLADLGADVIKVEPPGGAPGRLSPPIAGDVDDPEASLRWWFNNRGKRSVVLDLERDRDELMRLIADADVLIESFDPGYMASVGLSYEDVVHDRLVYTSITPFGQAGPHASWKGPDIVLGSLGGQVWLTGDPDRAPVRISVPQYELHGAAEGAVATMIALYHAASTGTGQHVDVAGQLAVTRTLMNATAFPILEGRDLTRTGGSRTGSASSGFRMIYRCADGHVTSLLGGLGGARALIDWMDETGDAPDWLKTYDWENADLLALSRTPEGQELFAKLASAVEVFFSRHTKDELYEGALKRRLLLAPVNTIADIRADAQLEFRGYFQALDGVGYAGPWAKLSATPIVSTNRAPRIGEHTEQVLRELPQQRKAGTAVPREDVFSGLTVWDMSWVGVGPLTARYLGDYGATVVRLDSSKRPDVLRLSPPFKDGKPGLNNSHFYADYNASKLGVGIDITKPLGREVAMKLVAWADVLLESFTPKTMAGWGMGYEELRRINPGLIMLSTCMQGQTGPRAGYRGFGQLMASLCGFYEITGWPDRDPTPVWGAYTDFICPRFTATALIAALDHRRRTGEGQHIDVSQYEAALQFLGTELLDYEVNGRIATRNGNWDAAAHPHGVYPCAGEDKWVAIAATTDDERRALQSVVGDLSDESIAALTRTRDAHEIAAMLQPDVPAGVVQNQSELHADPQVRHRGYFVELEHTDMGRVPYDGLQAILSRTPGRLGKAAPCVGEDTWHVLHDLLGLSEDEIGDLIATEAVEITGGEGE
jgi:crotonobetainyl-CoA:carnitine CoA-transferase CaiB-like acyl-CoA transferase